jgi:hypothetical protein
MALDVICEDVRLEYMHTPVFRDVTLCCVVDEYGNVDTYLPQSMT